MSVHPRLRGELPEVDPPKEGRYGSSPLTRGTRCLEVRHVKSARFIPAYAGNSSLRLKEVSLRCGSSPLTRGTPKARAQYRWFCRFIPAYAGNSVPKRNRKNLRPVHPRLRGELSWKLTPVELETGSSPLTRGTHCQFGWSDSSRRFIPAYAGNSDEEIVDGGYMSVHPRLRGELIKVMISVNKNLGSSPLTRGTQQLNQTLINR